MAKTRRNFHRFDNFRFGSRSVANLELKKIAALFKCGKIKNLKNLPALRFLFQASRFFI